MKKKVLIFVVTLSILSLPIFTSAQDTLEVPVEENALVNYVASDTNSQGEQKHKVYKLKSNEFYTYNEPAKIKNPVTIVAPTPKEGQKPPTVRFVKDQTGELESNVYGIVSYDDITIKNIRFIPQIGGITDMGAAIKQNAEDKRVKLVNCYFTGAGTGYIWCYSEGVKIYIDKCYFRNGTSSNSWVPFGVEAVNNSHIDTMIIRNSTFFNMNGTVQNTGRFSRIDYFEVDHNTVVNTVRGFGFNSGHSNSKITNNIFYNLNMAGGPKGWIPEGVSEGNSHTGHILDFEILPGNESDTVESYIDEADRKYHIKNNVYYWPQELKDLYESGLQDSVVFPDLLTDRAEEAFNDDESYPHLVYKNNKEMDPEFTKFGGTEKGIQFVENNYAGEAVSTWGWDPDSADYPEKHWLHMQWPLPEDFTHNIEMKGTDGYHLGSLQFYTDEMEEYYDNLTPVEDSDTKNKPKQLTLSKNYPNPFNPVTNIKYKLVNPGKVKINVYNVLGEKVKTLVNTSKTRGSHITQWKGTNEAGQKVSSGIYFYQIKAGNKSKIRKMMLMK